MYNRLFSKESILEKRFYNIGAGGFKHSCWTNVDSVSEWYQHNTEKTLQGINYDLFSLQPLPVESNSAELIYTSHVIEHVNNEAVQNLFNEAYRILKQGALIRIVTPDAELQYKAYVSNDRDYFYWLDWYSSEEDYKRVEIRKPLNQETIAQIFLEDFASQASEIPLEGAPRRITDEELAEIFRTKSMEDAMDYCISLCSIDIQRRHPGAHMNWFHQKKLSDMLSKAGFKIIYRSAYGQSFSPVLRDLNFFDTTLPRVSLYMEAIK
jgi:predicted SAM-dependent methyltransferase